MVSRASSETQEQIVGARESLNGRKNKARRSPRRKVKNGEKSPWVQCLTRPVPNGRSRSGFWLVPEKHKFSGTNQKPERRPPFGTGLVRPSCKAILWVSEDVSRGETLFNEKAFLFWCHTLWKLGRSNCCIFEMKHASGLELVQRFIFLLSST